MLELLLRGSVPLEIRTSPLILVSFQLPAMTVELFFGDDLIRNLALFLKVPSSMIRITKIVRENVRSRRMRRDTGLTVQLEIRRSVVQDITNTTSANGN